MPEIPEVESFRKTAQKHALNKPIKDVKVKEASFLQKITKNKFTRTLKKHKFTKAKRHGKYLFLYINKQWLVLHFGMTGELIHANKKEPDYTKITFDFADDFIAYINKRKLGKVYLVKSKEDFIDKKDLGPDAMGLNFDKFYKIAGESKGTVKGALMKQSSISGIGNEYSDEILYSSKIHPESKSQNLKKSHWKKIHNQMKRILDKAIEKRTKNKDLPKTWILSNRDEGAKCPRCKGKIKRKKIAGRSSYFCPDCQKVIK
jgi:formamidopyrimidine-DNA glycosylase